MLVVSPVQLVTKWLVGYGRRRHNKTELEAAETESDCKADEVPHVDWLVICWVLAWHG